MSIVEKIIDKHGFDLNAFEFENEYSAKNLLAAMKEIAELSFEAGYDYGTWMAHELSEAEDEPVDKEQFINSLFKTE